jgi:hypothetical protein
MQIILHLIIEVTRIVLIGRNNEMVNNHEASRVACLSYSTFLDGLTRRRNLNQKVQSLSCRLKLGQIKYEAKR